MSAIPVTWHDSPVTLEGLAERIARLEALLGAGVQGSKFEVQSSAGADLSVGEVAGVLGLSVTSVYRLGSQLRRYKAGGVWRYPRAGVDEWRGRR